MSKFIKSLKLKKHKDAVVLFVIILISASIYILSLNGIKFGGLFSDFIGNSVYSIYKVVDYPLSISEKLYKNYIDVLSVKAENKTLKSKLKKIDFKLNRYREYRIENRELKALLFLKRSISKNSVPAAIMLHGIEGWFYSLYINKGKKDGIKNGDGVISYGGVVGRVVYAGGGRSKVIPVTNPKCVFSVIDSDTGTMGIAQGIGNGYLKMRFVFNSQKINAGDKILTSGLGGVFTPGIYVGRIASVKKKNYNIFQRIIIIPYKNLFNGKYVLVEK
ncbi:MAG: rod shape-determining protein MreC [bacterium]